MERKLPEINLGGTTFFYDVAFAELRQKDEPLNIISVYDMENKGSHYEAFYSPDHFCLTQESDNTIRIVIPPMVQADPEGVAKKYDIVVDDLPMQDRDLRCPAALYEERLQGKLPEVRIGNDDYTFDWRLKEIRLTKEPWRNISLRDLDMNRAGDKYLFFYHQPSSTKVELPEGIKALPSDVVLVALPFEMHIDPVGVARQHGMEEVTFVNFYPIQRMVEAPIYPLSVTGIPQRIKENLAQETQSKGMRNKL